MNLSVSTLLLFILISPGFLLRFYLNHKSKVRRVRVAPDALHSGILLLIYSVIVHAISITVFWLLYRIYTLICGATDIYVHYTNDFVLTINGITEPLYSFAANHFLYSIAYLIYTIGIVYAFVCVLVYLSKRFAPFARLLYGPLFEMVMKGPDLLTAFVLTKISHNGKQIMYSGYAKEVGVRDGSKIDYVVLETPVKFYLSLTGKDPKTTFDQGGRQMDGLLFLDCDKIENVHFQGWEFT